MVQHLIKLVNYLVLIKILFVQIADVRSYLKLNNFASINNILRFSFSGDIFLLLLCFTWILESNYLYDNSVPRHFSSNDTGIHNST